MLIKQFLIILFCAGSLIEAKLTINNPQELAKKFESKQIVQFLFLFLLKIL